MAPALPPLVLHEKNEVDSTSKYVELQYKAPPWPDDVMNLNKQFETYTPVFEGVCLEVYVFEGRFVGKVPGK
jgi:hypothetical protein